MTEHTPILTVSHLDVTLGDAHVLHDISFEILRGQTVAILGPNGSGKSTLLRALLDLVPHTGTLTWARGIRVGYVPQVFSVEPSMPLTVAEFFALKHIGHETTVRLLRDVGVLTERTPEQNTLQATIGTLSAGIRQRMLIAWALADEPSVLLFDEPTSGVDVGGQQNIYALLDSIKRERDLTMLLISHDLHVVFSHADTVLCINGSLTCSGPPREALDAKALAELYGAHISLYQHVHHE